MDRRGQGDGQVNEAVRQQFQRAWFLLLRHERCLRLDSDM